MFCTNSSQGLHAEGWNAARQLAVWIAEHGALPLRTDLQAWESDVAVRASISARAWWYGAARTSYEHHEFIDFGTVPMLAMSLTATTLGNRRARQSAAALSAPQWRSLSSSEVEVWLTDNELGVSRGEATWSFWLKDGINLKPDASGWRLEFQSARMNWFAIEGPWVPYMAVALTYAATGELLALDSKPPPPNSGWLNQCCDSEPVLSA